MKVLITGTSRGIGKAIAEKFLSQNHEVVGLDVQDKTISHQNYTHLICDVSLKDCLPEVKNCEIVIANAGVQTNSYRDIEVNLIGVMNTVEKYANQKDIKAVIINASVSAVNGAEFPYYSASKGGLLSYMKNVAQDLGEKYGATINAISPGGVMDELNSHILDDPKLWHAVLDETILDKWMSVDELAEWFYFVAVTNKSMTGQNLVIDNGETTQTNFIW